MSISLAKKQKLSLKKETRSTLTTLAFGAGWDKAKPLFGLFGGDSIDLDLSAVCLDANYREIAACWFRNRRVGSVLSHSGDNLTGDDSAGAINFDGESDDEIITLTLPAISASAAYVVFTLNSFRGQTFKNVKNAYGRLVDGNTLKELARFNVSAAGPYTGLILCSLKRVGDDWVLQAHGVPTNGKIFRDMMSDIRGVLSE